MRRISVPPYALALAGGVALGVMFTLGVVFWAFGGEDDQPRQAQTPECPPRTVWPPDFTRQFPPCPLDERLASRQMLYDRANPSIKPTLSNPLPLIAARVVGPSVRYVLKSARPADVLTYQMSHFLWNYRFGVRGRPMVVRLLDGKGRLVWAAGYEGAETTWVRVRPDLAGCGPHRYHRYSYGREYRLGRKTGDVHLPPCKTSQWYRERSKPSILKVFPRGYPLVSVLQSGGTSRYVLKSNTPARFLKHGWMTSFLWNQYFGVRGAPMVVRLLDGEGRLAWGAEYDGVQKMSVWARPQLRGCGPILYAKGHTLPLAAGSGDRLPCPWPPNPSSMRTVLR